MGGREKENCKGCKFFSPLVVQNGYNLAVGLLRIPPFCTFALGGINRINKRKVMRKLVLSILVLLGMFLIATPSSAQGKIIKGLLKKPVVTKPVRVSTGVSTGVSTVGRVGGVIGGVGKSSAGLVSGIGSSNAGLFREVLEPQLIVPKSNAGQKAVKKGNKNDRTTQNKTHNRDISTPDTTTVRQSNPQNGRLLKQRRFQFLVCPKCGGSGKEKVWNAQTKKHSEKQCEMCKGVGRGSVR
jgi:hypothetical protein